MELIKLNVVTHNFLAMKKTNKQINSISFATLNQKSSTLPLEHEVSRSFIFPQLANIPPSCCKFLYILLWLWRIMKIQVWVQRSHNFDRLGFDTTWNLSWPEKSVKHGFQRLACHSAEIRMVPLKGPSRKPSLHSINKQSAGLNTC